MKERAHRPHALAMYTSRLNCHAYMDRLEEGKAALRVGNVTDHRFKGLTGVLIDFDPFANVSEVSKFGGSGLGGEERHA
eukprot:4611579-Amphidinium_carterae.1